MPVHVVQPLGSMTYVTVGWDEQLLTSRLLGMAHFPPGELVTVSLDPAGVLFFDRESGRRVQSDGTLA
jgi:ABC-type sugar transport system ATPase subunit